MPNRLLRDIFDYSQLIHIIIDILNNMAETNLTVLKLNSSTILPVQVSVKASGNRNREKARFIKYF